MYQDIWWWTSSNLVVTNFLVMHLIFQSLKIISFNVLNIACASLPAWIDGEFVYPAFTLR